MIYRNTHKKTLQHSIMLSSLGLLLLLPSVSSATYSGQCFTELNTLEYVIQNADFLGKKAETSRSMLLVKLEAAKAKITRLKFNDAADKLENISENASKLADSAKPKLTDASDINNAAGKAIGCVGEL